jgi:hypothetical protein
MSDKIHITWDEVNSAAVDQKLRAQSARARTQQHYEQYGQAGQDAAFRWGRLMYNTLVYMAAFGLAGGLAAWLVGECVEALIPNHLIQFAEVLGQQEHYTELANRGEMSQTEAGVLIDLLRARHADNPYLKITSDASLTEEQRNEQMTRRFVRDLPRNFIQQILWFSSMGVLLSFCLSIGDAAVSRNLRGVIINGSVGIVLGLIGSVLVSLFINHLYRALLGRDDPSFVQQVLARTIGWAILGGFLTLAPGVVLKNRKRLVIGLVGGVLGGTLGGMLFDPLGHLTGSDLFSRLVAISSIGLIAGLGTGLIETVVKTGWLYVVAGLIAGKQFVLYKNPTSIGSSPGCEIYLFKDPAVAPRHAAVHKLPDGYYLEDQRSGAPTLVNQRPVARAKLRSGDAIQIGSTVFAFRERG